MGTISWKSEFCRLQTTEDSKGVGKSKYFRVDYFSFYLVYWI